MKRFVISAMLLSSAVYAAPATAQDKADDETSIVVTGARPRSEATAGTKGSAPIAETPQSISVISAARHRRPRSRQPQPGRCASSPGSPPSSADRAPKSMTSSSCVASTRRNSSTGSS